MYWFGILKCNKKKLLTFSAVVKMEPLQVHRFTGELRLEGISGGLSSNFLLKALAALKSAQIAQGCFQTGLENPQEKRQPSLPGQPAPMLGCPHGEKFSHNVQPVPHMFQVICAALILPPCPMWRPWLHHLLTSPWVPRLPLGPLQLSFLQAEQALIPQSLSTRQALQPPRSGGPPQNSPQLIYVFPVLQGTKPDVVL